MLDVNMIIANNIQAELKKENKKQVDLAEGIGVSKQTMSKIMNTYIINTEWRCPICPVLKEARTSPRP